ncbi:MAG: hypothetical protein NC393_03800 [Clostridium sp.]|nr:hypothetical protein [Clostridium sp.]MCM1171231.1 hypothetical protein [Clostridium sp.]MCM1207522.1 hypothetical protein [Ruminococcus sp.]
MYDMMQYVLSACMVLFGIFMIAFPKQSTKKEYRDDPKKVGKVRKAGIVWVVCGVMLFVLDLVLASM